MITGVRKNLGSNYFRLSLYSSQVTHQAGAYPGFCSMRRVMSISTTPWMGCQSIAGLPPSIKFAGTYLYTLVERGTVRVKCLAQEHNTMSPARTRTARSGVERTNHEATAPHTCGQSYMAISLWYRSNGFSLE